MRHILLTLALLATLSAAQNAVQAPHDCRLNALVLGNGAQLSAPFSKDHYDYFCSCLYSTEWTTVTAFPVDSEAVVKLFLGDNQITPFYPFTESPQLHLNVGSNVIRVNVKCYECEKDYTITCERQPPNEGNVQGDPQFTGILGQNYQVHGIANEYYNIISDNRMQMNSKFVFLNKGTCPVINGKKQQACWTHPGQYLGEVGIKTVSGDRVHMIAGDASHGFAKLMVNNKLMKVGDEMIIDNKLGSIKFEGTHLIIVKLSTFEIHIENSDMFVNSQVKITDWTAVNAHGLLGQTWRDSTYPTKIKYIEGNVDNYLVADGLFGDAFLFNQFPTAQK